MRRNLAFAAILMSTYIVQAAPILSAAQAEALMAKRGLWSCFGSCFGVDHSLDEAAHHLPQVSQLASPPRPRLQHSKSSLSVKYPDHPIDINHIVHLHGERTVFTEIPALSVADGKLPIGSWDVPVELDAFSALITHTVRELPHETAHQHPHEQ